MERVLLVLVACVALHSAHAGEFSLLINGHARHLEQRSQEKNELNYGLGLQYDFTPRGEWVWFAFGSGFQDSRKDPSYNAGGGLRRRFVLMPSTQLHLDLGIAGMLMTRESYNNGQAFPAALPIASIGIPAVAVNIAYVPPVDPRIIPLLFFQLKYRLQ